MQRQRSTQPTQPVHHIKDPPMRTTNMSNPTNTFEWCRSSSCSCGGHAHLTCLAGTTSQWTVCDLCVTTSWKDWRFHALRLLLYMYILLYIIMCIIMQCFQVIICIYLSLIISCMLLLYSSVGSFHPGTQVSTQKTAIWCWCLLEQTESLTQKYFHERPAWRAMHTFHLHQFFPLVIF